MKKKILVSSLIIVALIILLQVVSLAETTGTIRFKAICEEEAVQDLGVAIYQVRAMKDGKIELTEQFKNCELDAENLSKDNIEQFEEYAKENAETMQIQTTDSKGQFVITGLELGTYLLVQNNRQDDYTMQTMLIEIPEVTSERGINYTINAEPKIAKEYPHGGYEPEEPEEPTIQEDPEIPNTGVLNWPIPVLAIAGIVIFIVAWTLYYSKKKVK